MKAYLIIGAAAFLFGCQSASKSGNEVSDSVTNVRKPVVAPIVKKAEQANFNLKNEILGIWADSSSENATLKINPDSIFYVEHFESYKYTLNGDSVKIFYPDFTYTGRLSFIKDTLVMTSSEDELAKFWKFKN